MTIDYIEIIVRDVTTDGEPCCFGWLLEAPGCCGQGETVEECRADLALAKADYMASLIADGLPLPPLTDMSQPIVIDLSRTP